MSKAQEKWDKRYLAKENGVEQAPVPPEYLKRKWSELKLGRVLDLAAGDGAASLYLAQHDFVPVAADISSVGLERLKQAMNHQGCDIETYQIDLEAAQIELTDLGLFDSIVISRYKPANYLWPMLIERLVPGGTLLMTTFNLSHHERTGFSQRFCLAREELLNYCSKLTLLDYESDLNENGMDSYLFIKDTNE